MRTILRSKESAVFGLFVVVFAIFASMSGRFSTPDNLLNVARQYSELAAVSVGLTMVIISGGIDISVGSVVGLSSILVGVLAGGQHMNIWAACGLAVIAGLACGSINGLVITKLRVQPIVATLAMMSAARGLAYILSEARSISGFPQSFVDLGQTSIGPVPLLGFVPISVAIALGLVILGVVILRYTAFGRGIYAVGSSEEAARLSGVDVFRTKMFCYAFTGILCGLGGVMMAARVASSVPDAGTGFEFEAITAVVMGGSSLKGGEGNIIGTIIGVAVMGILRNGLNLTGVPNTWQVLFLGIMLILAVLADNLRTWLRTNRELQYSAHDHTK
ncbi:MAG: ABC transporter permease [Armatimonadetes bacterium]|nr:ABC transporter permease [Armatimonadota bacterium]